MSTPNLTDEQYRGIQDVLDAIVADAILLSEISSEACARNGDANLSRSAEIIAQRIGALADHTLQTMGAPGQGFGSIQDWIMPDGALAKLQREGD